MRFFASAVLGLGLLATACDAPSEPVEGTPAKAEGKAAAPAAATVGDSSTFKVNGHIAATTAAASVDVMALAADGGLTTVTTAPVNVDGTFNVDVPAGSSPTQIFIIKVKDIGGAIVGSGTINGFLQGAFFKAFFVDAPIDTETSFKSEVMQTLAKKGVPGVQNYLNVVDTFVNDEVSNSFTVLSVETQDIENLVNTTTDAVIAGEDVLESTFKDAGIPLDLSALQAAQVAVMTGIDGEATSSTGQLSTTTKNYLQGLQAATAKSVAPVDQLIFNAVVNATGAMGHSTTHSESKSDFKLSATKSAFSMQAGLATQLIQGAFAENNGAQPDVIAAVQTASTAFTTAVSSATSVDDLTTAQTNFANLLLSKNQSAGVLGLLTSDINAVCSAIESCIAPCLAKLTTVYTGVAAGGTYDYKQVGAALTAFDQGTATPPAMMTSSMNAGNASTLMQAVNAVRKLTAQ